MRSALEDTRVVAIVGPRQSGKTTLVRRFADQRRPFVTLDDEQFRSFATNDPTGFIRQHDCAVIDEVQRAPNLLLAIKRIVDEQPSAGRFLVTGSVDLFQGLISPDSLAGRMETIELLPFSQAEIAQQGESGFLARAFAGDFPRFKRVGATRNLVDLTLAGGFPEALARGDSGRRTSWLLSYLQALTRRDVTELSRLWKPADIRHLVSRAALASSQLVNQRAIGSQLGIDGKTVDRWLGLLEQLFLLRRVPAWHRHELKRLIKTPKIHFLDPGLLAAARRVDEASLRKDRKILGSLLECFAYSELQKLISLTSDSIRISHYRDKDQVEVDLVLENLSGDVVGIEIKASATIRSQDFKGLRLLRRAAGSDFVCGILLHDGDHIQQFENSLYAMPFKMFWMA